MRESERRARADDASTRLVAHPRWVWVPGLVFQWHDRHLIVVKATARRTVYGHFLGQEAGVEIGIDEHRLIPDLLSPITAGVLFSRWAQEAHYATIQADRFRMVGPRPQNHLRVRALSGAWALTLDSGSQIHVQSDDELGIAAAEALLALWGRFDNLTPRRLHAATDPPKKI